METKLNLLANNNDLLTHYISLVPDNVLSDVKNYILSHLRDNVMQVNIPLDMLGNYKQQIEIIYILNGWKMNTDYMTNTLVFGFPGTLYN